MSRDERVIIRVCPQCKRVMEDTWKTCPYCGEILKQPISIRPKPDLVETPSLAWYLVPFLFGLIGGIIGYVGTKDRDEDMAVGLLVFGIIWTFVLWFIGWLLIASLLH